MLSGAAIGVVRVGLVPSVVASLFRRALLDVNRTAQNIQIRVIEGAGDQMLEAVVRGSVDFAVIGRLQVDAEPGVVMVPLGVEEVCVAARSEHPIFSKTDLTLADLGDYRWALPEKGNAIWHGFNDLFRRRGLEPPTPTVATNSVHTLKSIVAEDDYLTMMTRIVFEVEERYGLMRPVPLPEALWQREIMVVRRPRNELLPAARLLLGELERQAGALDSRDGGERGL